MSYKGIIYKAINQINNKIYIRQTTVGLHRRKLMHYSNSKNPKYLFPQAIKKYGFDVFERSIIWEGDYKLLSAKEIFYIKKYNSFCKTGWGYNMTTGGEGLPPGETNPNYNHTCYTFYHRDGRVEKDITIGNMRIKYSFDRAEVSSLTGGYRKILKGWSLSPDIINDPRMPLKSKYSFIHKNGTLKLNITVREFQEKYNLFSANVYPPM